MKTLFYWYNRVYRLSLVSQIYYEKHTFYFHGKLR